MSTSPITPFASASLLAPKADGVQSSAGSTTTTTSTTGGLTGTSTGTTFLNLLVKELQNQDPSAPMDSTAMVGQMISLNQLDQLISINQNLTPATAAVKAAGTANAAAAPAASADLVAQKNALIGTSDSSSSAAASAAVLAANNPNTTLNLSQFTNQFGGK